VTLRAYLDKSPSLGEGVYVDPTALVIGDVTLGAHASVWPKTVIRGDVNHIRIGARSNVQDGSVLHVSRPFPGREAGWPLEVARRSRSGTRS
jgi:carbonic anhydrase/acetyltransferase-like protein (isoleucine patch superfamily)